MTRAQAYRKIRQFLWVRKEPVGSRSAMELCHHLGGHIRYQNGPKQPPIWIARWSGTPHPDYEPMTFEEFLTVQMHGAFPLRNTERRGVCTRISTSR